MARVRAPELRGAGGWIGARGSSLAALRGRFVLLDFYTLCCVNCVRVGEELRGLERRWGEELVVIGVHSPKFPHEHDHEAVRTAVARHRTEHPVIDDPARESWGQYAVRAWPTLVLVDPYGYEVGRWSGEGHAVAISSRIEELLADGAHRAQDGAPYEPGALGAPAERLPAGTGELAFPAALDARPDGRLAIADTGHDRVLVCAPDGEVLAAHDGLYQPQGVRWAADGSLLVCETGADRVWRVGPAGRELLTDRLAAPADACEWNGYVVIAESGRHRLWALDADGEPQVIAGSGGEALFDGPALGAGLAQPSALATTVQGELAWVDAETSALRVLDRPGGRVRTLVGEGLFDWGSADGDATRASMQHPLGLAAGPDGALWICDTFNHALRVWREGFLWTVPVGGLDEPGGITLLPSGVLAVADTTNHRIVLIDPVAATLERLDVGRPGSRDRTAPVVAETLVLPAGGELEVRLDLALGGDVLDPAGGSPVRVHVEADPPELLRGPADWTADGLPFTARLLLGEEPGTSGRITVELLAATCAVDACRLRRTQRAYDLVLS